MTPIVVAFSSCRRDGDRGYAGRPDLGEYCAWNNPNRQAECPCNAATAAHLVPNSLPKQINAGLLNVGYAEDGPADGPAVMLLHGWPYDIYSFVDVAPLLASQGYRVIVPYVRGYGTTRFLSSDTLRNGQPSALAVDTVALRWTPSRSRKRSWPVSIGERGLATSSRCSGQNAARPLSR